MLENKKQCPFEQFEQWFRQAKQHEPNNANAMTLATCDQHGHPHARIVLLKHHDQDGFVFFTNLKSAKAQNLQHNPQVSLLFYWKSTKKQIRILGRVHKTTITVDHAYFKSRPRMSQIGAWASHQSQVLPHQEDFKKALTNYQEKFLNQNDIPCPPYWGGFRVTPESFEFWQEKDFRLHDRMVFTKQQNTWKSTLLFP